MSSIRRFTAADWAPLWAMIAPVFQAGATYPFAVDINEADAHQAWIDIPQATFVCLDEENTVIGSYYIKANQPGLGSHVCNCGYIVAQNARGKGIATAMCRHSLQTARKLGYRAMQFNLVVSTNKTAVKLWQRMGFEVIGTLPGAFNHQDHGFVDALIMYQTLVD